MHDDQLTVTVDTVRSLIDEQFPEWRRLPVRALSSQGTVNAVFRVGDELAARLPLQPVDVSTLRREAEAARELAGQMWAELRELPREAPDVMTHGDLIPGNVLVAGGRLVGVLDVGGFGPADPALDLVGAWHLLTAGPRRTLRDELGCGELEWQRGRAWAFQQAMGLVWYYEETNPVMHHMGKVTLSRLLEDD